MKKEKVKYIYKNIIKTIVITILFCLGLFVMRKVSKLYYNARFPNDDVFYISGTFTVIPMLLIISTVILIEFTQKEREKYLMQRKIALVGTILGIGLGIIGSTNFNKYTLEGVTVYTMFGSKNYLFADALKYTVTSTPDGILRVMFKMKEDKIFIFQGTRLESISYTNQTGNAEKKYILETAEIMKRRNVPSNIISNEEIDRQIKYKYWNQIGKEINKIFAEETVD